MVEVANASLVSKELIFLDYEASDKEDLITNMSKYLQEKGYVKETFLEAILKRELVFPTGLRGNNLTIAIPHTDAVHVEKPGIFFTRLKDTVTFKEMGLGVDDVDVKLVFMLLIKNPKEQVSMLSNLMSIFSKEDKVEVLINSKDKEEIYEALLEIVGQ